MNKKGFYATKNLTTRMPILLPIENDITMAISCLIETYSQKGKVLVCGNGGSASDADHITGELMKGFLCKRPVGRGIIDRLPIDFPDGMQSSLRAISLNQNGALMTAIMNDLDPHLIFAQQVLGLGDTGDVFWGISTSGNAKDVHYAALTAKVLGLKTIGLTGSDGGRMAKDGYDVLIQVPASRTFEIQELHLPVYHAICAAVEANFYNE